MKSIAELLPLVHGDALILRAVLSRMTQGRSPAAAERLLKRLEAGTIGGDEIAVLRRLVEKECTVRGLVLRQHEPGPDPDPAAPSLQVLEALKAKLDAAGPCDV